MLRLRHHPERRPGLLVGWPDQGWISAIRSWPHGPLQERSGRRAAAGANIRIAEAAIAALPIALCRQSAPTGHPSDCDDRQCIDGGAGDPLRGILTGAPGRSESGSVKGAKPWSSPVHFRWPCAGHGLCSVPGCNQERNVCRCRNAISSASCLREPWRLPFSGVSSGAALHRRSPITHSRPRWWVRPSGCKALASRACRTRKPSVARAA